MEHLQKKSVLHNDTKRHILINVLNMLKRQLTDIYIILKLLHEYEKLPFK